MSEGQSSIEWVEDHAKRNYEYHERCRKDLEKAAQFTLSIVLVSIGALFGFCLEKYESFNPGRDSHLILIISLLIVMPYLSGLAVFIVLWVLQMEKVPPPSNEPKNLLPYLDQYPFGSVRRAELNGFQTEIDTYREQNWRFARRLSRARLAVCLTPLVFVVGLIIAWIS